MIIEKNPIFQQAYFVNSIDESAKKWSDLYGAGPFVFTHHHKTDKFEYRNTSDEADVSYAFGYLGDTMIQFIEQHDETPSIYRDMFEKGQEGFHHIGILVSDFEEELNRFLNMGFDLACRLWADGVDGVDGTGATHYPNVAIVLEATQVLCLFFKKLTRICPKR